jgi:Ni,Fe-hydrogenase III component G
VQKTNFSIFNFFSTTTFKKMQLTYSSLRKKVHKKVHKETILELHEYLENFDLNLWGLNKDKKFLKKSLYLTLYKDLKGIGSIRLKK